MLMTYVRPTVRQQREEQARTQTAMVEAVVGPEKDDSILCYRKSVELEIAREADGSLSYLEIGYTCGEPDNKVRSRAEALALLCEHAEQAGISISRPLTEGGIADVVAWSEEHPPKEKGAK